MVCYARPAGRFAALLIVALLVFGRPVSHFLDTAAILVAALAATGVCPLAPQRSTSPMPKRWNTTMLRPAKASSTSLPRKKKL